MRIGLDVMGGDNAPEATVSGAVLALKEFTSDDVMVLFGNEHLIRQELAKHQVTEERIEIVHSENDILMGEHPIKAFNAKSNSSIALGFQYLADKKIDAFSSAGNTGAMLVGAIYAINTVPGIIRPATSAVFPREDGGQTIILDVGTNPDAKPDVLYQFAILGSIYANHIYNIENPRVALLNIGEEEKKGNIQAQSTYQLMKNTKDFNFIGNVEGRDMLNGKADVIVCDGFTGNIALKQMESVYQMLKKRGLVDDYIERFNYENHGGTPILGINSSVIIGHGISNAKAIKNMILHSRHVAMEQISTKIKNILVKYTHTDNEP